MSQEREQILIDHLDRVLAGETSTETAMLIENDETLAKEWRTILFAVEGIREAGLYEKVSNVKKQYQAQQNFVSKPAGGVIRSFYRNTIRVAACLFVLIGATAIYKYNTVNPGNIFNESFSSYELNTSRSADTQDEIETAYRAKNWKQVIALANTTNTKTAKTFFLSAMSSMELKNYTDAISSFKNVLDSNTKSGETIFQDETEYYLALSYLANNNGAEAMPLLTKIRNDRNHLFYEKANKLSGLDLKILDYKSGK